MAEIKNSLLLAYFLVSFKFTATPSTLQRVWKLKEGVDSFTKGIPALDLFIHVSNFFCIFRTSVKCIEVLSLYDIFHQTLWVFQKVLTYQNTFNQGHCKIKPWALTICCPIPYFCVNLILSLFWLSQYDTFDQTLQRSLGFTLPFRDGWAFEAGLVSGIV